MLGEALRAGTDQRRFPARSLGLMTSEPDQPQQQGAGPAGQQPVSVGRAFLFYSMLRLLLLLVAFVVFLVLGLPEILAIGAAVLASALLSLVLLRRQREAFTDASVARARERRVAREQRRSRLEQTDPQQNDAG